MCLAMTRSCPVCGSGDIYVCSAYRGSHEVFSGLMRAQCRNCDMGFASPMPSPDALLGYNSSYFVAAHGGIATDAVAVAFLSGIARLRVAYLERYLKAQCVSVSSLLEFGPGQGLFAASWLGRHPDTTYLAYETDTSCHAVLTRLGVRLMEIESSIETPASVDLVVMSHVLEHVAAPKNFLEHATKTLRKGGCLFVEVPCLDYEHKPIDEPHLLFFDKKPMQQLLSSARFDSIELGYFGQEIGCLRSPSLAKRAWAAVRSRMISRGLVAPFAMETRGMELLSSPLERAAVAPLKAHCESTKPAWWLRAVARKR